MVIADDGRVSTIGASLNGISGRKSTTVFTPLPEQIAEVMASKMEDVWEDAEVVWEPEQPSTAAEDTAREPSGEADEAESSDADHADE